MQVTTHTQINIVIGSPINHSQSPLLHNTVYQYLGLDCIMIAKSHSELNALIQAIKTLSITLTAVTMPFKKKVFDYLDESSPEVALLKTANTLIQRENKLYGYNTDVAGIAFAFNGIDIQGAQVLVVGAGGAAQALGYFLKMNKAHPIWINRDFQKAVMLAEQFGGEAMLPDKINKIAFDIIINTTPVGLYPHVQETPLPHYVFNKNQIVFDMVYHPVQTQLLKQAQEHNAKTLSGLDMFIGQGLKQIELLTECELTDTRLINKLRKLLGENQSALYS